MMNHWMVLPIVIPLLTAMGCLLLGDNLKNPKRIFGLMGVLGTLAVSWHMFEVASTGAITVYTFGGWPSEFGIVFVLDRLAATMVLLTNVLALFAYLYAITGPDTQAPSFHFLFLMQITGVNGAFLTGDLFNLFVMFEILLLTAYVLVVYGSGPARTRTGMQYVFLNLVGSALFLIAVGVIYGLTGTLNMAGIAQKMALLGPQDAMLLRASSYLLLIVFAVKAGLFPLYFWLPHSYAAVSAPVAALFAIMTKVGVYALLRSTTMMFGPGQGLVEELAKPYLLPAALLTLVMAVLGGMAATKLRTMTAYLLLASIGTMLAGFGLFTHAAISGSLYYLLHSTLVMGALFLVADLVMSQRGPDVRDAFKPGPKIRQPVLVGMLFFVAVVAVAGLPPLSGFLGKAQILWAAIPTESMALVWTVVLVTSFFTLVALSRAATTLFWKTTDDVEARSSEAGWKVFPIVALLTCIIGMTIFAGPIVGHTDATASQLLSPSDYINAVTQEAP